MKKLTKTVALLLTLTISFSLVGCGTKKSENQTVDTIVHDDAEVLDDSMITSDEKEGIEAEEDVICTPPELEVTPAVTEEKPEVTGDTPSTEKDPIIVEDILTPETIPSAENEKEEPTSSQSAIAPVTLPDNWDSMMFSLDGVIYDMSKPFDYSLIGDDWTLFLEPLGYADGYIVNKHSQIYNNLELINPKYEAVLSAAFANTSDTAKDILDCQIYSIVMNVMFSKTYPDLVLPGGITWDSTAEEIISAYGEPEPDGYYAESLKYTVYEYVTDDYNCHLKMNVYDDGGIGEIRYSLAGI